MHLSKLSLRVGGGGRGESNYPLEFDSKSLPQSRDFDTCHYPRDFDMSTILEVIHDHNFFKIHFFFHFSAFLLASSDGERKKCERICFILP